MSPLHPLSLPAQFAALRDAYAEIDGMLAQDPAELARVETAVSGWSAEQQLAHLALANELICRNVKNLARGEGLFVQPDGEPISEALPMLESGVIPRGRVQSPRMVRPPPRVQRELLVEWIAGNRREFEELERDSDAIERATARVPHQTLGPLTAPLWIRFAAVHTGHHVAIAREILARRV